ncbi:hypothetical protein THAOC_02282 [Thalassiosira oceanica]|uniref:MYND-type domain-containing protein n=1 Tax=Thalassiosira oceanica TaxID=159749 RepID=K0TEX9_THAOC|nr:hypothetical protein THAOC_02282 [Thalassiosira oceanica]|eukprot:EJK75975.1 hypothetical protein THAOC_02282 [Thalassiosira oceanica]
MDLLQSLGLDDLPEQSTRLAYHPGIAKALDADRNIRLGFDACLTCGKKLSKDVDRSGRPRAVSCRACNRVSYCSKECRGADAKDVTQTSNSMSEEEVACGHSPVVCALLNLCNDDDSAEEEIYGTKKGPNMKREVAVDSNKMDAARYRVQTERESYPATLFNIIAESPGWYIEAVTRRLRRDEDPRSPTKKRRRDKRDRETLSPVAPARKRELVIHVVGASEAELWEWKGSKSNREVLTAYAEASTSLVTYLETLLDDSFVSIRLVFVGPDCPETDLNEVVPVPDSKASLFVETLRRTYDGSSGMGVPDVVVFFNPGLSCTDYDWSMALERASSTSATPTPFLLTTNTELEGFADVKYLLDGRHIDSTSVPKKMLEAIDHSTHDEEDDPAFFFSENPYAGLRVRQSGTMANDLYCKSRWVMGGLLMRVNEAQGMAKKRKGKASMLDDQVSKGKPKKKRRMETGEKKKNPSLI